MLNFFNKIDGSSHRLPLLDPPCEWVFCIRAAATVKWRARRYTRSYALNLWKKWNDVRSSTLVRIVSLVMWVKEDKDLCSSFCKYFSSMILFWTTFIIVQVLISPLPLDFYRFLFGKQFFCRNKKYNKRANKKLQLQQQTIFFCTCVQASVAHITSQYLSGFIKQRNCCTTWPCLIIILKEILFPFKWEVI